MSAELGESCRVDGRAAGQCHALMLWHADWARVRRDDGPPRSASSARHWLPTGPAQREGEDTLGRRSFQRSFEKEAGRPACDDGLGPRRAERQRRRPSTTCERVARKCGIDGDDRGRRMMGCVACCCLRASVGAVLRPRLVARPRDGRLDARAPSLCGH